MGGPPNLDGFSMPASRDQDARAGRDSTVPLSKAQHIVPLKVDRIWSIWGSYFNIPKAIFYLLKVDYNSDEVRCPDKADQVVGVGGQIAVRSVAYTETA